MQLRNISLVLLLFLTLVPGCAVLRPADHSLAGQVDVLGVELFSAVDHRQLAGVPATEEPCIKGYERAFNPLEVSVGYGFDGRIRKITTRNPHTSIFAIRPGMAFTEGRKLILQAGLADHLPPFTFRSERYSLKLLVDAADRIFGITLESLE